MRPFVGFPPPASPVALLLMALVLSFPAAAARVAILPVDVDAMGARAENVRTAIEQSAKDVLRQRAVLLPASRFGATLRGRSAADCLSDPGCRGAFSAALAAVAQQDHIEEFVVVRATDTRTDNPWAMVQLVLLDAQGQRRYDVEQGIYTDHDGKDLLGLFLQVFEPHRFVGQVRFDDVEPGQILEVDGLATAAITLPLRPGRHRLVLRSGAGVVLVTRDIEVFFDQVQTVRFKSATAPSTTTTAGSPSVLPVVLSASATTLGIGGVVVGILYDGTLANLAQTLVKEVGACPAGGGSFSDTGALDDDDVAPIACTAANLNAQRAVQTQRHLALAGIGLSATIALLGGVATVLTTLPLLDEAGPPSLDSNHQP